MGYIGALTVAPEIAQVNCAPDLLGGSFWRASGEGYARKNQLMFVRELHDR